MQQLFYQIIRLGDVRFPNPFLLYITLIYQRIYAIKLVNIKHDYTSDVNTML